MGSAAGRGILAAARRAALVLALVAGGAPAGLAAREIVEASPPTALAVTVYRDPERSVDDELDREWPRGFAMIGETRTVTLPPGESTIRFVGVAEGMVAVSAIVGGLPGGTIEKNRNAELLSPASLVDGTLGNRVTVTRTDPATGTAVAQEAIVRTRADGGLVLQTADGFEAVRCAGLPEKLTFDRVPGGLSAQPVFSVDTRGPDGGTYTIQLTYLAWGFDWQAHYVAHVDEPGGDDRVRFRLMSWLTLVNDNGQSFEDAELLVVAGRLNLVSDLEELADAPEARALRLTCYPLGSTATGSPIAQFMPPRPRPGSARERRGEAMYDSPMAITTVSQEMLAAEEALGDLKLYRVPERVTLSAKGMKQVAFLDEDAVEGRQLYRTTCWRDILTGDMDPAQMLLATVNDEEHGLGMALPMGGITVFEPSARGEQLVAGNTLRDHAEGQEVEIALGASSQVFATCERTGPTFANVDAERWEPLRAVLTNANPVPVTVRLELGADLSQVRGIRGVRLRNGGAFVELTVPANGRRDVRWEVRGPL